MIQCAIHQKFLKFRRNHPFRMKIHSQIRIFPFAGDAKSLEFLALDINPSRGKFATFLTKFDDRNRVFISAFFAVFLFYFPLNGQTVTIPTWDIARIFAHHLLRADHHIFEDLIECMADMQVAIGIGRPVMQGKTLTTGFFPQPVINADLFPTGQPFGFTLWQAGAHGKICLRQIECIFVVSCLLGHISSHLL